MHPHENYPFQFSTCNDKLTQNFDVVANFIYKVFSRDANAKEDHLLRQPQIFKLNQLLCAQIPQHHYWIYWESKSQETNAISVFHQRSSLGCNETSATRENKNHVDLETVSQRALLNYNTNCAISHWHLDILEEHDDEPSVTISTQNRVASLQMIFFCIKSI